MRSTVIRAEPACTATRCCAFAGVARLAGVTATVACGSVDALLRNGRFGGGGNSVLSPPRAKTISPGRTPSFHEAGVNFSRAAYDPKTNYIFNAAAETASVLIQRKLTRTPVIK